MVAGAQTFLAAVPFLARPKPEIPFLRDHTKRLLRRLERKAVIALVSVDKTRFVKAAMSSDDRKKWEKS